MFLNKTALYGGIPEVDYKPPIIVTFPSDRVIPKYNGTPYTIPFDTVSEAQDYFDFDAGKLVFKQAGLYHFSFSLLVTQETGVTAPLTVVTTYIAEGAIRYGYGGVSLHPRQDTAPDLTTVLNYGTYLDVEDGASIGCYVSNFTTSGTIKLNKAALSPRSNLRVQSIS